MLNRRECGTDNSLLWELLFRVPWLETVAAKYSLAPWSTVLWHLRTPWCCQSTSSEVFLSVVCRRLTLSLSSSVDHPVQHKPPAMNNLHSELFSAIPTGANCFCSLCKQKLDNFWRQRLAQSRRLSLVGRSVVRVLQHEASVAPPPAVAACAPSGHLQRCWENSDLITAEDLAIT